MSNSAVKEVIDSLKSVSLNRVRSPLFGSFILSWCAYNWRVIGILYSDVEPLTDRFKIVDDLLFIKMDYLCSLSLPHGYLVPLLAALSYVLWMPKLQLYLEKMMSKTEIERKCLKIENDIARKEKELLLAKENTKIEIERNQGRITNLEGREESLKEAEAKLQTEKRTFNYLKGDLEDREEKFKQEVNTFDTEDNSSDAVELKVVNTLKGFNRFLHMQDVNTFNDNKNIYLQHYTNLMDCINESDLLANNGLILEHVASMSNLIGPDQIFDKSFDIDSYKEYNRLKFQLQVDINGMLDGIGAIKEV